MDSLNIKVRSLLTASSLLSHSRVFQGFQTHTNTIEHVKEGYQLNISCKKALDQVTACSLPACKMFKESNSDYLPDIGVETH